MENLNKENFWNALMAKYPKAVEHFCNWIDEYKNEVKWNDIFGKNVKFHDLPFEMQNGIIARYELELYNNHQGKGKEEYLQIAENYAPEIKKIFQELQQTIEIKNEFVLNP